MASVNVLVDRAVRATGVPIDGITIGDLADRATWAIAFAPEATAPQRAAALALLLTVPIDAPAQTALDRQDAQAFIDTWPIWAKALALAIIDQLNVIRAALPAPLPPITVNQAIAAIRAKAGTL